MSVLRMLTVAAVLGCSGLVVGPGPAWAESKVQVLDPNTTTKLDVPNGVRKIYISNPSILDAEPEEDGLSIIVTALSPGDAEVRVTQMTGVDEVYQFSVRAELDELADEVRGLLAEVEGIEVRILGKNVVLAGELFTRTDAKRVKNVASTFGGQVVDMTELDLTGYVRNVEKAIAKQIGRDTVEIEVRDERIIVTGSVPSEEELERVTDICDDFDLESTIMLMVE